MARLLVVISRHAQLEGVVADTRGEQGGAHVFYRDGVEVARAQPGEALVVRDLQARRSTRFSSTQQRLTIAGAG